MMDIKENPVIRKIFIMNTIVDLKAYGENAQRAIDMSVERLKYIESIMSAHIENSDVCKININSGVKFTKVKKETLVVIKKAIEYSKLSAGGFDITIKPIIDVWKSFKLKKVVPDDKEIKLNLNLVNYEKVRIIFRRIKLDLKNQKIDLGGIAKGYAADEVVKIMKKNNVKSGIIDLGGNVVVIGNKNNGEPWKVGIQNPFKTRGEIIGYLKSSNKSVVTSGDYERFIMINEKKYQHFLNPKTGYPIDNEIKSVTIVSDKSIDGDGLTSCCFSMGLERGLELIKKMDGIDGILITKDKEVYVTKGISNIFTKLDSEFKYIMDV